MPTATSPGQAIDFLTLIQNLKVCAYPQRRQLCPRHTSACEGQTFVAQTTKRTGWVRSGVAGPESIADHMYRMGMMALLARDAGVDTNRCTARLQC